MTTLETVDLIYNFVFDDAENPLHCQIYPEARNLGIVFTAEYILDFEMHLMKDGDDRFPGSKVWKRVSAALGKEGYEYALVQVIDGSGERIEPAWSKFTNYQSSTEAGTSPGTVFYHEADDNTDNR